ncbi:MAG: T9SS type A sorting domain-containing protein [Saprospiraceae bacterium]|nr:T9SS type A sorting domain-containing protein [Saprospiraceae bacterium]
MRFGTFGRGIWDFKLSEPLPSATNAAVSDFAVNVYPNPAPKGAVLRAAINAPTAADFELLDLKGRVVAAQKGLQKQSSIALGALPGGVYVYRFSQKGKMVKGGKVVVR